MNAPSWSLRMAKVLNSIGFPNNENFQFSWTSNRSGGRTIQMDSWSAASHTLSPVAISNRPPAGVERIRFPSSENAGRTVSMTIGVAIRSLSGGTASSRSPVAESKTSVTNGDLRPYQAIFPSREAVARSQPSMPSMRRSIDPVVIDQISSATASLRGSLAKGMPTASSPMKNARQVRAKRIRSFGR
jgi:hypothetical protein